VTTASVLVDLWNRGNSDRLNEGVPPASAAAAAPVGPAPLPARRAPVAPAPLPARHAGRAPPATPASRNDPGSAAPIDAYRAARLLWRAGLPAVFPPGTYWLARFANITVARYANITVAAVA
jgi:hypothetical protein